MFSKNLINTMFIKNVSVKLRRIVFLLGFNKIDIFQKIPTNNPKLQRNIIKLSTILQKNILIKNRPFVRTAEGFKYL